MAPFGRRGWFRQAWVGTEPTKVTARDVPRITEEFLQEKRSVPTKVIASEAQDCGRPGRFGQFLGRRRGAGSQPVAGALMPRTPGPADVDSERSNLDD
jgi:hypothetical protein